MMNDDLTINRLTSFTREFVGRGGRFIPKVVIFCGFLSVLEHFSLFASNAKIQWEDISARNSSLTNDILANVNGSLLAKLMCRVGIFSNELYNV